MLQHRSSNRRKQQRKETKRQKTGDGRHDNDTNGVVSCGMCAEQLHALCGCLITRIVA